MTGSSFAFSCPMVHDGEMRRSDEEFSDVTRSGMSPAVCRLMVRAESYVTSRIGVEV